MPEIRKGDVLPEAIADMEIAATSPLNARLDFNPVQVERDQSTVPARDLVAAFTENEMRRLSWLRGTVAAEQHLVLPDRPCPDHQACRRLAFALWLRCSGRLSESDQDK